jgi:hypothetical protein
MKPEKPNCQAIDDASVTLNEARAKVVAVTERLLEDPTNRELQMEARLYLRAVRIARHYAAKALLEAR